jgi:hypothetical protein
MSDQCIHCVQRGDMDKCKRTSCGIHTYWYVKQLKADHLSALEVAVKEKDEKIEELEFSLHLCRSAKKKQIASLIEDTELPLSKRLPMTDDDRRKILTEEVLGECWHEGTKKIGVLGALYCEKCGEAFHPLYAHRTFFNSDDWDDLGAVRNKLVEVGKWEKFERYCYIKWLRGPYGLGFCALFAYPPTLNQLAAEFSEQENEFSI